MWWWSFIFASSAQRRMRNIVNVNGSTKESRKENELALLLLFEISKFDPFFSPFFSSRQQWCSIWLNVVVFFSLHFWLCFMNDRLQNPFFLNHRRFEIKWKPSNFQAAAHQVQLQIRWKILHFFHFLFFSIKSFFVTRVRTSIENQKNIVDDSFFKWHLNTIANIQFDLFEMFFFLNWTLNYLCSTYR